MAESSVRVISRTWARDTHDLFDYESKSVHQKLLICPGSCSIVKHQLNVRVYSNQKKLPQSKDHRLLAHVHRRKDQFYLASPDKLWLVLKYLKGHEQRGCVVSHGDVLKLGRITLAIRSVFDDQENFAPTVLQSEEGTCRVCFSEEGNEANPLVAPCACTGSVKVIHLECLRKWIQARKVPSNSASSWHWKSIDCEICKSSYPLQIMTNGSLSDLFNLNQGHSALMLIDRFEKGQLKGVHVVAFRDRGTVTIGRGSDSDIHLSDISVSRVHATFHYSSGQFFFQDHDSKFGSLILAREPIKLNSRRPTHVQVGGTVLGCAVHTPDPQSYLK